MNSKPVVILGAGGHAKVIADILKLGNREVLGFITPDLPANSNFNGKKVLGDDSFLESISPDKIELANGLGSLPNKHRRWDIASAFRQRGFYFVTLVHPTAIVSSNVKLAAGVQVMAGVILQLGVEIGEDTIINTGSVIDHDCKVAKSCHIASGVTCSGNVRIGSNTHIGTGSNIIQSILIGEGSVIAAGSIIYKNIPDRVIVKQKSSISMEKV